MNDLQKKFEKYKVEREVDEHNESYSFREGYVKAMCDAINAVKKFNIADASKCIYCGSDELNTDEGFCWNCNKHI